MRTIRRDKVLRAARGFTLVELMVVVCIVSILAAVTLPMFKTYVLRARSTEASGFLADIKTRQESYRADFGQYCDVSPNSETFFPSNTPTEDLQDWTPAALAAQPNWQLLGVIPPGREGRFVYSVVADGPGGLTPSAHGFDNDRGYPSPNTDFWFIASALGDLDGDGKTMRIEAYSHSRLLYWSTGGGID